MSRVYYISRGVSLERAHTHRRLTEREREREREWGGGPALKSAMAPWVLETHDSGPY